MPDVSTIPVWAIALVWPALGAVILIAWLLRRARGSSLKLSGFGVTLEVHDVLVASPATTHTEVVDADGAPQR